MNRRTLRVALTTDFRVIRLASTVISHFYFVFFISFSFPTRIRTVALLLCGLVCERATAFCRPFAINTDAKRMAVDAKSLSARPVRRALAIIAIYAT